MNTVDINRCFIRNKKYLGTFCCDNIPVSDLREFGLIFNTDPCKKEGRHWVALYVKDKHAEYFDSFGSPPVNEELYDYVTKSDYSLAFNTRVIQHPLSTRCGEYAIYFLKLRFKNQSISEIVSKFSRNLSFNDIFVQI